MTPTGLSVRSLRYYWRTNIAVGLGIATAVAVLTGALLVGDSVRGSLRDLLLQRLGRTDYVVVSDGFFREQLASDIRANPEFEADFNDVCPIVAAEGFVTQQNGNGRAGKVRVYGVDDRFWRFHGVGSISGPTARQAFISPALARELQATTGANILIRVPRPSDVPIESLHANKEDLGRTMLATVHSVLAPEMLGEFSLSPQQGEVRAVFVPIKRLQQDLETDDRVNVLLVSAKAENRLDRVEKLVRSEARLEDLGLKLRVLQGRDAIALESNGGLINDTKSTIAIQELNAMSARVQPVFTYVANSIRTETREVPYSLVTAMDLPEIAPDPGATGPPPILLNDWAARDLNASRGDIVKMDYFVWEDPGRLATRTAEFTVAKVVPLNTADRDLAPVYPGITESNSLSDWNPPFPIDLKKIRPIDEEYWKAHRTTPKAFIHFAVGFQLWRSRYGSATSIRATPDFGQSADTLQQQFLQRLRAKMDPLAQGLAVKNVKAEGISASRGATDFGEYFVYFSFFLVISALVLAALFFKLSVEQRVKEVGLLRAVGFKPDLVLKVFLIEASLISIAGAVVGSIAGIGYAIGIVAALRTWWIDAVGTTSIGLHVSPVSIVGGAVGGILAAVVCIWFTLRALRNVSDRQLLSGEIASSFQGGALTKATGRPLILAIMLGVLGAALVLSAASGLIAQSGAFFGAGSALLAACLCLFMFRLGRPTRKPITGSGWVPVSRMGCRNITHRPARSVLSIAMIAAAIFILISVDAFRRDARIDERDRQSGIGGYSLLVETLMPIVRDPAGPEGRELLGLAQDESVVVEPFRVRPGDDASCLNLYQPQNPRIMAPSLTFIARGGFSFRESLASTDAESKDPWLLLVKKESDDVIPVIADANSMAYVLHRKLGEDIVMTIGGKPVRLRLVAALSDSIFQSELLMSPDNFVKLFPEQQGYQFLLIETAPERAAEIGAKVENALTDFGADASSTAQRLASFHRVENTYLSTFQMLGGLGLLLGTVGLSAVMMRNVLERRRELALLRALGYRQGHFFAMVVAENTLLLLGGLVTGVLCALIAIAPVLAERGGRLPVVSLAALLGSVLLAGLLSSIAATAVALRSSLLPALRSE